MKGPFLYIGINETKWNHHPVAPGPFACVAPLYGSSEETRRENRVFIPEGTTVINDSAAFHFSPKNRPSYSEILDIQILHSIKYNFRDKVSHLASFDLLIDEIWTNGNRHKRRWSENDAWEAVRITVEAAHYLSKHYRFGRILSAQGVTAQQYLDCTIKVLTYFNPEQDIFGLGGWCISGKMPRIMREPFDDTMVLVIPALARSGVKRVHIWGVMDIRFLGPLLFLCDEYELELSTDSTGPSVRPTKGVWGYRGWVDPNYKRPSTLVRGLHRKIHVERTREWLLNLRTTTFYKPPKIQPKQMSF